jgi:hypothetical protein
MYTGVDENKIKAIYQKVNAAMGIGDKPLFLRGYEELARLISNAYAGQKSGGGSVEAVGSSVADYGGIAVGSSGDGEDPIVLNTPTPSETVEPSSVHGADDDDPIDEDYGEDADDASGEGKDGAGEGEKSDKKDGKKGSGEGDADEDGEESDGKGKGKGKKSNKKGKKGDASGQGDDEGEDGDEGEESDSQGSGKGKKSKKKGGKKGEGEGEGEESDGEGDNDKKQGQGQGQAPQPSQATPPTQMTDDDLLAYQFKFQNITRGFFGEPLSYNTFLGKNKLFESIKYTIMCGVAMSTHETFMRKYADYPAREYMIRKDSSAQVLQFFSFLVSMECLQISDDYGNPIDDKREELVDKNRTLMVILVTADRIFENLLPLHFVFRPDLFSKDKVIAYVNFCMTFVQRDKKFLLTQNWNKKEESPNFIFVNKLIEDMYWDGSKWAVNSGSKYKVVAFKHGLSVVNGVLGGKSYEYSFEKLDIYSVVDKKVSYVTSDEFIIMELQKMLMSLMTYWFGKSAEELKMAISDYNDIILAAEFFVANSIKVEYSELTSKKFSL